MIWQRIASAAVAAPVLLVAVWVGGPVFSVLVAALAVWAALEFYSLVGKAGHRPVTALGVLFVLLFVGNAYVDQTYTAPLLTSLILIVLAWLLWRRQFAGVVTDWAVTLAGVLYAGWLLSLFVSLRDLPQGLGWTVLAALATFASDTGAFAVGSLWGRRRLVPHISPGKTLEGSVGGLVSAVVVTMILGLVFSLPVNVLGMVGLGLAVGTLAQIGDLAESMLKRSLNVKDASRLIPGHGGILDRVDSLGFAVVVVFFWAKWVVG
jgi:phosphatidate cytidylyltransferase